MCRCHFSSIRVERSSFIAIATIAHCLVFAVITVLSLHSLCRSTCLVAYVVVASSSYCAFSCPLHSSSPASASLSVAHCRVIVVVIVVLEFAIVVAFVMTLFNSAVLVRLLAERQNRQAAVLRQNRQAAVLRTHARSTLSPELELRTQDGRWCSLPRHTDPARRADQFNANHVMTAPSQLVPGLLGVYARRDAYLPATAELLLAP
jgi:hypothetical protein